MLREGLVSRRNVKAGHAPHFRIAQRRHNGTQIIWLHANIAVVNDQNLVPRLIHHTNKLGYLVIDGIAPGSKKNSNLPVGKVASQLLQNWHRRITFISNTKNQLKLRIVLPAIARQVFVSLGIQAAQRFEVAHGRRETGICTQALLRPPEKSPGAEKYEQVINKRGSCEDEKEITSTLRNHCTPCAEILLRLARSLNCFIAKQENSKKRAISPSAL